MTTATTMYKTRIVLPLKRWSLWRAVEALTAVEAAKRAVFVATHLSFAAEGVEHIDVEVASMCVEDRVEKFRVRCVLTCSVEDRS